MNKRITSITYDAIDKKSVITIVEHYDFEREVWFIGNVLQHVDGRCIFRSKHDSDPIIVAAIQRREREREELRLAIERGDFN